MPTDTFGVGTPLRFRSDGSAIEGLILVVAVGFGSMLVATA